MTTRASTTLRNALVDAVGTVVGANGLIRVYDGSRPAALGAVTTQTLLVELPCNATFAAPGSGGAATINAIGTGTAAASGTAAWARIATSAGVAVIDVTAGTSGAELLFPSLEITKNQPITISSATITAGNV